MSESILGIDHHKIWASNGVFAMCYHISLPEKYSLGEDDLEAINDFWSKAFKYLPANTIVYKQDIFLRNGLDTKSWEQSNFLQKATQTYFDGRTYLEHRAHLFFIRSSIDTFFNDRLQNPFKRLTKKKYNQYDESISEFTDLVEQAVAYLNHQKINSGVALTVHPFTYEETLGLEDFYFNGFNDSIITDRTFEKDHIQIGDRFLTTVCINDERHFPDHLNSYKMDKDFSTAQYKFFQSNGDIFGFDLNFDHVYNQIVFIDDSKKHIRELERRNDQLEKSQKFSNENKIGFEQTQKIIEEVVSETEQIQIIRGHNNIIPIANSVEDLKNKTNQIIQKCRELDIKAYLPIANYLNATFTYSFPLFTQYFSNTQTFRSSLQLAVSLFNNTTNYKSDPEGILFNSRFNSNIPIRVDTWDENKKYMNARNFFIIAPTGYGKSFLANHVFRNFNEQNNSKTVIIDLGGSYKKLAALYGDTAYITYKEGQSLGINPFLLEGELTSKKIEELTLFVQTHYRRDKSASQKESTALKKIIERYYLLQQSGDAPHYSFLHFIDFVDNNKDTLLSTLDIDADYFDIKEFLFLLSDFRERGLYEFLYREDDETLITSLIGKRIIVFELDEIKDNELLLTIMLQLIGITIEDIIWQDKSTRGYIFFDEFAKQLKFEGILTKVEYFFQAVRKQNSAIGIVLQSITQLPENTTARSIIENTQMLYVLNAKDYREIQKRFHLSEHAYQQLVSIQSNFSAEQPYSEVFIMRGQVHGVYRLETPKEVFWAYQTEGKKNEMLLSYYEEIGTMEEAIKEMIAKNI